jgi:hypothetical protein
MTGYTVHTGSTVKFSDGWDRIFGASEKAQGARRPVSRKRAKSKKSRSTRKAK